MVNSGVVNRVLSMSNEITPFAIVDGKGSVMLRPDRRSFESDVEYLRAIGDFRNRCDHMRNLAFDESFRAALRRR